MLFFHLPKGLLGVSDV